MSGRYYRPPMLWIKRRARRIQAFFSVSRRLAILSAAQDYRDFTGQRDAAEQPPEHRKLHVV